MTSTTAPYAAAPYAPATSAPAATGFWRAPFAAATYREVAYTLTSLPLAVAGFGFAVSTFALGASLAVTVLGLPVLAAMLAGARGLGAVERGRALSRLGLDTPAPQGVPAPRREGRWAAMEARLKDRAGWQALLFQVVMFPWRVTSFVLTLTFLVTGWVIALLPAYSWVFPHYVGWPGYRIVDFTSGGVRHAYYIESPLQIAAVSLIGFTIVFLTPKLVRALTNVDRAAVRGMLSR
ncbi:sensor domain-containing protein [Streptomyces sp. NPDC050485]|uniref:sensor domain-containing protein n=1 Tax=Streptomyces sp. NPDC050485 TaxID=3365617 RepID=UPI0037AAF3BA